MATSPLLRLPAALLLLALGLLGLPAQDFSYTIDAEGNPVFTQTLRWEADENALEFEFGLRRREEGFAGPELLRERTGEREKALSLPPGDYEYEILTFNLLGKAEDRTAWIPFRVLPAEQPRIAGLEPPVLHLDERDERDLVLRGQSLVPGCEIALLQGETAYPATVLRRAGKEELLLRFPEAVYRGGDFDLRVVNPGGLGAEKGGALRVRPPLPAPELLSPAPGSGFGAAELRASRNIELAWKPVEGATDYRLEIYAEGGEGPFLVKEGLHEARYALEDLSALGRAGYAWKVRAFARDAEGALDRLGLEAGSSFSIRLPFLSPALPESGGEFFAAAGQVSEGGEAAGSLLAPPELALPPGKECFFHVEQGLPVFTQVLRWRGDPNALEHRLLARRAASGAQAEIISATTEANALGLRLPPGHYEYKIQTRNLLGQDEAETGWIPLEVGKAELPRIAAISPGLLYLDSFDTSVTIRGLDLEPGCRVLLISGERSAEGTELQRKGSEELVLAFPPGSMKDGVYDLAIINPGGLSATEIQGLRIRFQKPTDILATFGYLPGFALGDDWVRTTWPEPIHALGLDAKLEAYLLKNAWGYLGLEAQLRYQRMKGEDPAALLTSDYLLWGAGALYKYPFSPRFHLLARAGGGLAKSWHSFDYAGLPGPSLTSLDFFWDAGFALQFLGARNFFLEAGLDFIGLVLQDAEASILSPGLRFGYRLF